MGNTNRKDILQLNKIQRGAMVLKIGDRTSRHRNAVYLKEEKINGPQTEVSLRLLM